MRRITKLVTIGNSLGIIIGKDDLEKIQAIKGDSIEYDLLGKVKE